MKKLITLWLFLSCFTHGFALTYYSKAAATDFTAVASWGSATDGTGANPATISNADDFIIQNSSVMNLNAGSASVANLTITLGSLTVGSNTLTVSLPTGNTAALNVAGGSTLIVTGGTITVNGAVYFANSSTFTQSGGTIIVDGNSGNAGTSIGAVPIFGIGYTTAGAASQISNATNANKITATGGTIRIVDPSISASASAYAFAFNAASSTYSNFSASHTLEFGNGSSVDAGGNTTNGFGCNISPISSGRLTLGNLIINSDATTANNRFVSIGTTTGFLGTITINSSGELRSTSNINVAGNIANNGIFTNIASTISFQTYISALNGVVATAQTVSGTGKYRNAATDASSSANFATIVINNNNSAGVTFDANSLLCTSVPSNTGTAATTLSFTAGAINTGSGTFILGTSIATLGSLSNYIAGGFGTGSTFAKWYAASSTGTAITASSLTVLGTAAGSGSYPFVVGANSRTLHINRPSVTGATGGIISVKHTDGSGLTTIGTVTDAGYTINRQTAATWDVAASGGFAAGTGTFSYAVSGQGLYFANNSNTRIMKSAAVFGTHQAGTNLPHGQRTGIAAADYTGTFYLGIDAADVPITSSMTGAWESGSTWVGGAAPVCGQNAVIASGHNVTVNASAAEASAITINSGGTLTVSGSTLKVGCVNNNNTLLNSGTLNVSGGTLNLNGNLSCPSGSTFSQTGGIINVDGNAAGVAANSVLTGTALVSWATVNVTLSGGTLTFIDPHAGTSASENAISFTGAANINASTTHTVQFGNGVSTDAGGNAAGGFRIAPGSKMAFGNIVMNSLASVGAVHIQSSQYGILGNLTITAGDFQIQSSNNIYVNGNVVNNGTLTTIGLLNFANYTSASATASTNAQTISGSGVFRNAITTPTANFASLVINNSNAAGVTFSDANSLLNGSNAGTVSGILFMTTGFVNTGINALVLGVSNALVGTLSYSAGGFASGSTFSRWWTASTGGATIAASMTPAGTATGVYPFAIGTTSLFAARSLYLNQTTAATTGGIISVKYTDGAGTTTVSIADGAYTVDTRSVGNWAVSQSSVTGTPAYTMALNAQSLYVATNGNSRITLASGVTGTHQAGSVFPNAQRTAISLANLTNTFYMGINGADVATTSIASGSWNDPNTWNKNAVPTCSDNVYIAGGFAVNANSTGCVSNSITINTGNTLTVVSGDLTMGCTLNNTSLTNNGTLTVNGGTLNINGNLSVPSGAIFSQTGGDINLDGNAAGNAANSVPSGTNLFNILTLPSNLTFSGGNFTVVDPPVGGTGQLAVNFNNSNAAQVDCSTNHTFRFGNGTSADAGTTSGFKVSFFGGNSSFAFGNLELKANSSNAATRFFQSQYGFPVRGNLTIESGAELNTVPNFSVVYLSGNLTVNTGGTLTMNVQLSMQGINQPTGVVTAVTSPQTISGGGTFRNAVTPTANLASFLINNTSSGGVTLGNDVSVSAGVGALTITAGKLILGTKNLTFNSSLSTIVGASASNYIVTDGTGQLKMSTASGVLKVFPIGASTTSYDPVEVKPTTGVLFGARVSTTLGGGAVSDATKIATRGWDITATGAGSTLMSLTDGSASYVPTIPSIGHYTGTAWEEFFTGTTYAANKWTGTNTMGSFSPFGVGQKGAFNAIVLAIELKSLTAFGKGNANVIQWTTNTEANNSHFNIERSLDGINNWTTIGSQKGKGNSTVENNYTFGDNNPLSISYYRLRSVATDGKEDVSKVVSVLRATGGKLAISRLFPTPSSDKVSVDFEATEVGNITAVVTDITGRVINTQIINAVEGLNRLDLNLSALTSGVYILTIADKTSVIAQRFVKN